MPQERILQSNIVEHLVVALQSGNSDLTYWAVVLLHDLAMCGEPAATRLLSQPGLVPALVLVVKKHVNMSRKKVCLCLSPLPPPPPSLLSLALSLSCSHSFAH